MKKLLLIFIVVLNTSFIEVTPRFWNAFCSLKFRPTYSEIIVEVIKADSKSQADKIFRKYLKTNKHLKNGVIETDPTRPRYDIWEIKKENILK